MEGLHVAVKDVVEAGIFQGFNIGSITLSHFFYADNALFVGDWSRRNINCLVDLLDCFYGASGLRLNLQKSNLYGVGVDFLEVKALAAVTGCRAEKFPFFYLGLPVGVNMGKIKGWNPIVERFKKTFQLEGLLIVDRRSIGIDYFSFGFFGELLYVSFPNASLGEKTFRGIVSQWRWRFVNEEGALWVKVISEVHGYNPGDSLQNAKIYISGIVGSINMMHDKGVIPYSCIRKKVGDGRSTCFWSDVWIGDMALNLRFNRIFRLDRNSNTSIA
uniref:Reverse transcriptase domain-containing protein n=1 Tax=Lactuca sativa TaxID=4236 RepID=A0A9R1XUP8_LACSA|nr:hypothetical protein LSAT_V11C100032810 [Lactuca sativa]